MRHEICKGWNRVAFISNALLPGYLSSDLIGERLNDMGLSWPKTDEDPAYLRWFSFPVVPPVGSATIRPVWVDFYIVPLMAPAFLKAPKRFELAERVALHAFEEAKKDGVPLTIGWGAYMKNATGHGSVFLERHNELRDAFSTTHGDAGTTQLVLETIRRAGFKPGFRVSVVGANGTIGEAVSRALAELNPSSICLIGKPDNEGEVVKRKRLEALGKEVVLPGGDVVVAQDVKACLDHRSDLVVVATTGLEQFGPTSVRSGACVLDMTTPAVCRKEDGWQDRLVLTSGCGRFHPAAVPLSFGKHRGQALTDVGAGGELTLWGCTGETIARAMLGFVGHVAGSQIPLPEIDWCQRAFEEIRFAPQAPVSFGNGVGWEEVTEFVRRSNPPPVRMKGAQVASQ